MKQPETIEKKVDIVIIGAGLTGLTTAYYLQKYGKKVAVVEKAPRIGGVMQTGKQDGFVFEKGPNTGVIGNTEIVELLDELQDHCEPEIANPEAKRRLIWKGNKWHAIPSGLTGAIATPLFSWHDKFRILGEPWRKPGTNPNESVADMVKRRMGKSFLEYAVDPFISGIYAGDPAQLITKYALPKLYMLEQDYGSFIKGAIAKKKLPKTDLEKRVSREVFSTKGGLHQLIQALGKKMAKNSIHTKVDACTVQTIAGGYLVQGNTPDGTLNLTTQQVITTVNAPALPHLLPFVPKQQWAPITRLRYAKVAQVVLGFKNWTGTDVNAFGGLIPSKEKRSILGVLFTSSFLMERAPKGGVVLSTFVGGIQHEEVYRLPKDELLNLVHNELSAMMQTDTRKADLVKLFRYPNAIPQYDITSPERLEAIASIEKEYPGLILAGNIRDGIGMADRIKQARTLSDQLK